MSNNAARKEVAYIFGENYRRKREATAATRKQKQRAGIFVAKIQQRKNTCIYRERLPRYASPRTIKSRLIAVESQEACDAPPGNDQLKSNLSTSYEIITEHRINTYT